MITIYVLESKKNYFKHFIMAVEDGRKVCYSADVIGDEYKIIAENIAANFESHGKTVEIKYEI